MGWFLASQGEYVEAHRHSKKALELFRAVEHRLGVAWSLYSLGILMVNVGKPASACVYTKRALELFRELGDRVGIAWARHIMGRIALSTKEYALMNESYQESLSIHQEQQNQTGIAYALEGFAHLAVAQNHPERGARLFGAAEALRERLRFPLPHPDRIGYEQGITATRAQLDAATFTMAWTAGRTMSLEQAIAEARDGNR